MPFGLNDADVLKALEQEFQMQAGDCSRDQPGPHHILYKKGWRPHLNPIQKQAIESKAIYKLYAGERFSGKCTRLEEMVYEDDGLCRLRRLNPGVLWGSGSVCSPIWSFSGSKCVSTTATGFYRETSRHAIEWMLENGKPVVGSPDHPIWCCISRTGYRPVFRFVQLKEFPDLKAAGFRIWAPLLAHPSFTRNKIVNVNGVEIDEDTGYLLGALCGDGCCNKARERGINFDNVDREVIDRVNRALKPFGSELRRVNRVRSKSSHRITKPAQVVELVQSAKLDCLSYYKAIPDFIVRSPKPVVSAFLMGLFDTDGTVDKNGCVSLCTTSEKLSEDVQNVLIALGIFAVRRPKKTSSGKPTWNIYIMGRNARVFAEEVGFGIAWKQSRIPLKGHWEKTRNGYPECIKDTIREVVDRDTSVHSRTWHSQHRAVRQSYKYVPNPSKLNEFIEIHKCRARFSEFLISDDWSEVVGFRPTEADLADLCVPGTHSFLCGGTINHNTFGALHELVDYCYRNDNTLGYIIVKETGIGSEGGAWSKLIYKILPEWQHGIGIEFTEPKFDMQTKKPYVWISNRTGGWSMIMMASLPVAHQVETKIRGREPQIIVVDEAQFLDGDVYFTALLMQLGRQTRIDGDPSKLIFCCNPEGPSHWLYQRFFIEPVDEDTGEWDDRYAHFHIPVSDNKSNLPPNYYEDYVLPAVKNDPIAKARLVDGEWVDRPDGDTLFGTYYSDQTHLRGDAAHDIGLLPVVGHPIIISYDLGAAHASITFCQIIPLADGRKYKLIIDELDRVGKYTPYAVLVPEIIERMVYWDAKMKTEFRWDHISDDSAFTVFRPNTGSFDHQDVERISAEYVEKRGYAHRYIIRMKPAPKGDDSIEARVRMFTDDLISNMVLVSATCPKAKEMIMRLPQDKDNRMKPKKKHRYVHNFDSATYGFFYYHARRTQVPGQLGDVDTQSSYYTVG